MMKTTVQPGDAASDAKHRNVDIIIIVGISALTTLAFAWLGSEFCGPRFLECPLCRRIHDSFVAGQQGVLVIYLAFGSGRLINRTILFSVGLVCIAVLRYAVAVAFDFSATTIESIVIARRPQVVFMVSQAVLGSMLRPIVGRICRRECSNQLSIGHLIEFTLVAAVFLGTARSIDNAMQGGLFAFGSFKSMGLSLLAYLCCLLIVMGRQVIVRALAIVVAGCVIYTERRFYFGPGAPAANANTLLTMWAVVLFTLTLLRMRGFRLQHGLLSRTWSASAQANRPEKP